MSRIRRAPIIVLAVATAFGAWFVAKGAQPNQSYIALSDWLTSGPASVLAAVMPSPSDAPADPAVESSPPITLPFTLYVGQMGLYGPKPNRLDLMTVTLDWRAQGPFLLTDGIQYPLIGPVREGAELRFAVQDLVGRKGRWHFKLRVGVGIIAGPMTPPGDPLLGGYLLVSQSATRQLIPPPPIVQRAR